MVKPNLTKLVYGTRAAMSKHAPEILMGVGITGMVTSTVLAVRATPKALALLEEEKLQRWKETGDDTMTKTEIVQTCWKCYIPAAITSGVSIACLIGSSSVSASRTAALAAAYQLSETALTEYKEKVLETVGEKKERSIREKISEDRVKQNPVTQSEVYVTNDGETLFLEPVSKRYFKSDIEIIRRIQNDLNKQMIHDISGYVSLSDFYDEIHLERTDISDNIGWNTNELIDIDFHPAMTDKNKPCIALYYNAAPKYGYDKL